MPTLLIAGERDAWINPEKVNRLPCEMPELKAAARNANVPPLATLGKCGAKLSLGSTDGADGKPQVVTDESFARDVIGASESLTVLVDAWAEWCGPCRMIAPVLDELAAEAGGRYKIAKLNVDENPRTASQFGIRSIPTMLIFRNGKLADQIVGAVPKGTIAARLGV